MPDSPPRRSVGAEAVGQVRLLRQRLRADAVALAEAAERIPEAVIASAAFKSGAGARRAWDRVLDAMPRAPLLLDPARHIALWRLLRPGRAAMEGPDGSAIGDTAVVVSWLAIGRSRGRAARREGPWGLSLTSHALGRLLERTAGAVDPVVTILEAHDALLGASSDAAATMLGERRWALPAGPGALLATVRALTDAAGDDSVVLATCETWISADQQLRPEQHAQLAAIRFRPGEPGRTLGDGLLLPAVLRPAAPPQVRADGSEFARMMV